jgi:hypothetical protein
MDLNTFTLVDRRVRKIVLLIRASPPFELVVPSIAFVIMMFGRIVTRLRFERIHEFVHFFHVLFGFLKGGPIRWVV